MLMGIAKPTPAEVPAQQAGIALFLRKLDQLLRRYHTQTHNADHKAHFGQPCKFSDLPDYEVDTETPCS